MSVISIVWGSGVENIKYITIYSANSISELTNDKVQDIIDNFSEHNDNDNTDVEEVSSHMTEISAGGPGQNSVEVSELIAPIPVTHGSNSLGNSSFTLQITPSRQRIMLIMMMCILMIPCLRQWRKERIKLR